jgi:hypothetical protein
LVPSRPRRVVTGKAAGTYLIILVVALLSVFAAPASAQEYTFTKVADSAADRFDPFEFGCSSINRRGDIAFRAARLTDDPFNSADGIYRANAGGAGTITTIVENSGQFDFIGVNPSMNDLGQVSFAANLDGPGEAILRGSGGPLRRIARTEPGRFNFFGFDTSISNIGEVAFKGELDEEFGFDEGLFSGRGGPITTHYLASTSPFDGNDTRPSINNLGQIAFDETIDFDSGIFVATRTVQGFKTIAAPDPDHFFRRPSLNDNGLVAFYDSFFDAANDEFVEAILTGDGGPHTTVVDTRGQFSSFGFRPPSLNKRGDVAFIADLDDGGRAIFVAPDRRVIGVGDSLDGATISSLSFCEEGLNDTGHLAFVAFLDDPQAPEGFRVAVFRASPQTITSP